MKQIRLVLAIILGVAFGLSARAVPLVVDQFQNYDTGSLGDAGSGGGGQFPGWNTPRSHIVITNGSGSLDGTSLGLLASAGDKVSIRTTANTTDNYDFTTAGHINGAYNLFTYKYPSDPQLSLSNNVGYDLYISFLYQFNDNTNFCTNGVAMMAQLNYENGGVDSASGGDAYWQLYARTNNDGTISLGIAQNVYVASGHPTTNWATNLLSVNQPFFVVVREKVCVTNGMNYSTNDAADLWVNPPANTFGTNNINIPSASASCPPGDGSVVAGGTGPGRFFIMDNGPTAYFDELRIATNSWADVTPQYGLCTNAGFTEQPLEPVGVVTQSAEINVTLGIQALASTSPTYQWEVSQNGSGPWTDISGAVNPAYTSPNLQYPADNGNEYRVVQYVGCDGIYTTSSVATVTITNTIPTASPSTVMDDTFPAGSSRTSGPGTTTHSQWVTSSASTYSDDLFTASGGGLEAIPVLGSSSLWMGYIVYETPPNRLPVDLAVGKEMIATLQFTPSSYVNFTNNGDFRIGLFDFSDANTNCPLYMKLDDQYLSGSLGYGQGTRGYMLNVDYGTNFSTTNPLSLYVRTAMGDNNLMGTTGDYLSMGSGPVGVNYSNTPAFLAGTNYTVQLIVARTATNTCTFTANITGGGLNLTCAAVDTNGLAYHRFDTIALRPAKGENAPDEFTFTLFEVQVTNAPPSVTNIALISAKHVFIPGVTNVTTNSVALTWKPTPTINGSLYFVQYKSSLTSNVWTTVGVQIPTTNYTDIETNSAGFYRVYGQ